MSTAAESASPAAQSPATAVQSPRTGAQSPAPAAKSPAAESPAAPAQSKPALRALPEIGPDATPKLPPGPGSPTAVQSYLAWHRTIPFLASNRRRYGRMYTIRALPWGRAVVVSDSELIKEVFTGDPAIYHAGDGNSMLAPVLGERSVLVLDRDEHLQARKRMLPPFHGEAVRRYGEVVEQIVCEEIERWPIGRPFELHPRMREITLEVILRAVIGVSDPERLYKLRRVLPATAEVSPLIMAMWVLPGLKEVGPWRRYRKTVAEANGLLREEIAQRRVDPKLEQREDVLSQLVRAGEIGDEELRDQIITLLMAGHETTTTGLAWAFERMLRTPEVLARAREGDDPYLDALVQETLRIRPVIPAVLRQLQEPVELGGWLLPAGVTVMPAVTLMHEDPKLFPEPTRFKPERFLEGGEGSTYTWIPFGGGRRRCLGAAFASFEMRVTLRTILERVRLRADRPRDEKVRNHHITLVPARGARVVREG
jgi:cytochrome P450 family 135